MSQNSSAVDDVVPAEWIVETREVAKLTLLGAIRNDGERGSVSATPPPWTPGFVL